MGIIIADLPTTTDISPDNYVIVEKPGVGEGTYKSTIGNLQNDVINRIDQLQHAIYDLNSIVASLSNQVNVVLNDIHTIHDDIFNIRTRLDNMNDQIGVLSINISDIDTRLTAAENTLVKVEAAMMWRGTKAQWEALSPDTRAEYKIVNIIDE